MTAQPDIARPDDVSSGTRLWALVAIALAIVLLQGALFLSFGPWRPEIVSHSSLLKSDSGEYEELARCILERHSFCDNTLRTPGYPLFIAAVYAVFGHQPWIVLLVQIAIAVASAGAVYALGREVHSARVGLIAAALWAFDPVSLLAPTMLLADGLFVLVLLGALYCYLRGLRGGSLRLALLGGILLGLATLVRPVGQYYAVILALAALFWGDRKMVWRAGFAIVLLLSFLLAISPWSYRNFSRFESIKLSTVQGMTLLEWQVAAYLSSRDDMPFEKVQESLRAEAAALGYDAEEGNPFKNAAVEQQLAMQYIWRDPGGFALATLEGMVFMYVNVGSAALLERLAPNSGPRSSAGESDPGGSGGEQIRTESPSLAGKIAVAAVILPIFAIQWVLFVLGARQLCRDKRRFLLGLALVSIAYFTLTTGVNGLIRFRMPMAPLFLLVGAIGVNSVPGKRAHQSSIGRELKRAAQQ